MDLGEESSKFSEVGQWKSSSNKIQWHKMKFLDEDIAEVMLKHFDMVWPPFKETLHMNDLEENEIEFGDKEGNVMRFYLVNPEGEAIREILFIVSINLLDQIDNTRMLEWIFPEILDYLILIIDDPIELNTHKIQAQIEEYSNE